MAPLDTKPIKSLPAPRAENVIRSYELGSMDRRTTIDVVVIIAIFLALILSLSVLAWCRPTLRAIPIPGTSVPITNTATPVHSTASPGRSVAYTRRIFETLTFSFYHWWTQASHNGIPRPAMDTMHHELTLSRVRLPAHASSAGIGTELYARSLSSATFAPTSTSEAPSIVNTVVDSEAVELHTFGGVKTPSTSSLADNADTVDNQVVVLPAIELIAHGDASPVLEVPDPS